MLSKRSVTFTEYTTADKPDTVEATFIESLLSETSLQTAKYPFLRALPTSRISSNTWPQSLLWVLSKPCTLQSNSPQAHANPHVGMYTQFNSLIFMSVPFSLLVRKSIIFQVFNLFLWREKQWGVVRRKGESQPNVSWKKPPTQLEQTGKATPVALSRILPQNKTTNSERVVINDFYPANTSKLFHGGKNCS